MGACSECPRVSLVECREPPLLSAIGTEIRIYATQLPRRLALLLAAYAARNIAGAGEAPCIYLAWEQALDALEQLLEKHGVMDKAVLVKEPGACRGLPAVLVAPEKLPEELNDLRLVLLPRETRGLSKRGLARLTVKPLEGVYMLKVAGRTALVVERDGELCEPEEEPMAARVARIIAEAVREYGPLTVKDAVQILAGELGVPRTEARRLLYQAAAAGLVRIEAGYVTA